MSGKAQLGWDELSGMEKVAQQIHAMPDGVDKEQMKELFHQAHAKVLEHYDMPVQVESPDAALAKIADYPAGIARTVVGEAARGGKALYDKAMGNPSNYSLESAGKNLADAAAPVGRDIAKPTSYYLGQLGVPSGPSVADIPGAAKLGIEKGGPLDFTARGAAGFAGDVALTPGNAARGFKAMTESAEEAPARTAQELREKLLADRQAARSAGAPGMGAAVKSFASGIGGLITDPAEMLARKMHDWRFRFADQAAAAKGLPLPSQIMWDANLRGVTTKGIRADMEKVLAGNEHEIDKLLDDPQIQGSLRGGDVDLLNDVRGSRSESVGTHTVARGSPSDANNLIPSEHTALYPLWSPEQQALEADLVKGQGAQQARKNIEDQVRSAEATNKGLLKLHDDSVARSGMPETQIDPDTGRQMALFPDPPQVKTSTRPEQTLWTDDGFIRANRPAKTVTTIEGTPSVAPAAQEFDPLHYDRDMTFDQVRDLRRGAQSEAKTRNWYNRRQSGLDPYYPGDPKNIEAEAALWGKMASHASNLETDMLDDASPGAGGKVFDTNRDTAGLLEGGPWLDRAPKTGATRRSQVAFNPFEGRVINMAEDTAGTAAMGASKVLRSPWTRIMALPAARAAWVNQVLDKQNTPTLDGAGQPGGDNPWALIYKYGAQSQ